MPSGKKSRRSRGAARAAAAPPRARRASPWVLIIAGAVLVLVVGGILAAVLVDRSSSESAATTAPPVKILPGAAEVQRLLKGIPQVGNVLGSPSAPATMTLYVDLQCPYCAQFETQTMPTIISRYVRTGKLKVEARIIAFIGPNSSFGRKAAIAAGEQDKMFNFSQLLFLNQGAENTDWLNNTMVRRAATSVPGIDVSRLLVDRNTQTVDSRAASFDSQMQADQVRVTPTILVGKTGSTPKPVVYSSPSDVAAVTAAVDAALR